MKTIVVGSAGQDGRILSEQLRERGDEVTGVTRGSVDIEDPEAVDRLLGAVEPDELYYLAAHHHSSETRNEAEDVRGLFRRSAAVHLDAWVNMLVGLEHHAPEARVFYASSSHVFGAPEEPLQDEDTPWRPLSAYGITKAAGMGVAAHFRARGLHVSSGILYNHESRLRSRRFVSQRITYGAVMAAAAQRAEKPFELELGDLGAVVDWGYAPDYVRAMQRIVAGPVPRDFVVATGVPHTVADFCALAFERVGLDWQHFVVERAGRVATQRVPLVGDATRLREATGWAPSLSFGQMVAELVDGALAAEPSR